MKKNTILVCGDIHGRKFWKKPCENVNEFDRVIFLGDYLDPYDFENISVEEAIENFKEIIELKRNNMDKVVLLLGNHDLPYFSDDYYRFSTWHCRHSSKFHDEISKLFADNKELFKIAHVEDNILFTHAGVESQWLDKIVKCTSTDINEICEALNNLICDAKGLIKLYSITTERGGRDRYGSCIWVGIDDMRWDTNSIINGDVYVYPIQKMKQVFGHTLQAFYDENRKIVYGDAIETGNIKMIDNANSYVLNTEDFTIEKCSQF